ncbi:hypothetical protein L3Q65_00685 (plasmid) [Amycolatopsis sp. FU40]|uniref:hypothetical protein n=1 Tax=Amycolatopsis sp. FU40 TaxID=2914159 RepID=UPI001F365565|nr:hypothetical protein [Amycolatopsis sp. FU40]UKD50945.1 hypothetical protein L3Q65_00685 [Amycolatopsis sp. FU40]
MSWITALSTSVTTTPILATGVGLMRPRPRNALRTAAFASAATLAASRAGLPLLDLVPAHAAAANTVLVSVATATALAWLGGLAPRVMRAAARVLRSSGARPPAAAAVPVIPAGPVMPDGPAGIQHGQGSGTTGAVGVPSVPVDPVGGPGNSEPRAHW